MTMVSVSTLAIDSDNGRGSGSALNPLVLTSAGLSAFLATALASFSIIQHLKCYRKPLLQRQVIRIMLMIPIYAIASFISLLSLEAAVVIDAIRDIYEAFVIYNFFHLLLDYLGGERSLLILLHGRPPKRHVFPVNFFKHEMDASDPFTFLWLKRGILQYVQVKPILAAVTLILKATGKYGDGDFRSDKGYLYVSVVYNVSICIALYCLAMFWVVINEDVKPFRPMPKFLCIKGILFFCFWQGIAISLLVKIGVITHVGPYTDGEHISLAISDTLICFEMPFFAIAHMFAFSYTDYIDHTTQYAARMPFFYAARDAFGLLDVLEDSRATLRGGVSYRTFEPVEGGIHIGSGRDRRIRAGLRYAKGGKQKYWLPMPQEEDPVAVATAPLQAAKQRWDQHRGYAPLLAEQAEDVVHEGPSHRQSQGDPFTPDYVAGDDDNLSLDFGEPQEEEDTMYEESRKFLFGDYNYPVIDVSTEVARMLMWDEEERILRDERAAAFAWKGGSRGRLAYKRDHRGYGAMDTDNPLLRKPEVKDQLHPAIIDYEQDNVPDIDIKGIRLRWNKAGTAIPRAPSRPGMGTSASSSGSSSRGLRPEDLKPGHVSDSATPNSEKMPHDAVDLIVEDPKAAQLEMEQERRRGEPALESGTGLKKVYRRKYQQGKSREVEIEEAHEVGEEPGTLPDKMKVKITDDEGRSPWLSYSHDEVFIPPRENTDVTIARETEPPPHARVQVNNYRVLSDEDNTNPWA